MNKHKTKSISKYIVELLVEKYNLCNDNNSYDFSELKRRLKVEVNARLVLVPSIGTTLDDLVNAIIDQIEVNKLLTTPNKN